MTVTERMGADGSAVVALDRQRGRTRRRGGRRPAAGGGRDLPAVQLRRPGARAANRATALGARLDVPITVSSELLPEFREYERASTCVLDAAVAPVMRRYLRPRCATVCRTRRSRDDVRRWASPSVEAVAAAPVHTLLSGPAAGVVAAAAIAAAGGLRRRAWRSTWAARRPTSASSAAAAGDRDRSARSAGCPFGTPAVAVHTVGAGGGSIACDRRRRRAAGRPAVGRRRAGSRLLRPRRHRADGHRRPCGAGPPARRAGAGRAAGCACDRRRRRRAGDAAGLRGRREAARGRRHRRAGRDAARAATGQHRARRGPRGAGAGGVRRGRPPARDRPGSRPGLRRRGHPAGAGRAERAGPAARPAAARGRRARSWPRGRATRRRRSWTRSGPSCRRAPAPSVAGSALTRLADCRYAGQSHELRTRRPGRHGDLAARLRRRARPRRTATPCPTSRWRSSRCGPWRRARRR